MSKKDENMDWEREAAFLASLPRTTPYRAPEKYFDDLTERINQSVFVDELLLKEDQGFTLPANYFEELESAIESKIAMDQIGNLVPSDGFNVPDQYFNNLQANILAKTSSKIEKPKVVRLWQSEFIKYAVAACFILLAASGLYLKEQVSVKQLPTAELANEQMLYDIDESVIIEHIQESQSANATQASNKEMENYILDNYSSSDLSNNL